MLNTRYLNYLTVVLALLLGIVVLVVSWAKADPLPIPNRGNSCPQGYYASGSYCVPHQGASQAIPLAPHGTCPSGWFASGSACVKEGR